MAGDHISGSMWALYRGYRTVRQNYVVLHCAHIFATRRTHACVYLDVMYDVGVNIVIARIAFVVAVVVAGAIVFGILVVFESRSPIVPMPVCFIGLFRWDLLTSWLLAPSLLMCAPLSRVCVFVDRKRFLALTPTPSTTTPSATGAGGNEPVHPVLEGEGCSGIDTPPTHAEVSCFADGRLAQRSSTAEWALGNRIWTTRLVSASVQQGPPTCSRHTQCRRLGSNPGRSATTRTSWAWCGIAPLLSRPTPSSCARAHPQRSYLERTMAGYSARGSYRRSCRGFRDESD